jgi:hypothetical protein
MIITFMKKKLQMFCAINECDWHTPKFLDGQTASPKVKTLEGERVRARSLAHSTSGVEGRVELMDGD